MNIINFEKQKITPLTEKELESYERQKICYICRTGFKEEDADDGKYLKVGDHCHYAVKYRSAAHSICNLSYIIPKEIPVIFHTGSNYDYHFIKKEIPAEFKGEFTCPGENTEKCITFSVPIKNKSKKMVTEETKLKINLCPIN